MARRKNSATKVGSQVFYKWRGQSLPAIIVSFVSDSDDGAAILCVFTENGVNVVHRVAPGNGDAQYSVSADAPAPVTEAPDESE